MIIPNYTRLRAFPLSELNRVKVSGSKGIFNIFYYHKPQLVMMDASVLGRNVAVLAGVILICGTLAIRQVSRRDIPG